jgi:Tfp pilus assembly protein PilF
LASLTGSEAPRLPFTFRQAGGGGKLALVEHDVFGWLHVDRLELDVPGDAPASATSEKFQRRRTQLRVASLRIDQRAIDARLAEVAEALAALGIAGVTARCVDGAVSVTARVADGMAAADVSFRLQIAAAGLSLRALAGAVTVHGHLPTPGPVIAHRILETVLGAAGGAEPGARARGLCDLEIDALAAFLWRLLPPSGWRLPSTTGVDLVAVRIGRGAVHLTYGPAGQAGDATRAPPLAAAHDAMRSADELLRAGALDDAMRGYRALLAAGGPEQPAVVGRILAVAAARPTWFLDGLELARQALGRWPEFAPAHAALASIALAKGDPRDAAAHLRALAELAADDGDDDGAALAALAAARLLRVLDPRAATSLYEQVLEHHPGHAEAGAALADRYADEGRWQDLVRLLRARTANAVDRARAARDHLRLADVLAQQLGDRAGARVEVERARALDAALPLVHETAAQLAAAAGDLPAAAAAWAEVARLAEERRDTRAVARAWAARAQLHEAQPDGIAAADADWSRALLADPGAPEGLHGAARAAARRGDHRLASELWNRLAHAGVPAADAARAELERGRALIVLGDDLGARAALAKAAVGRSEVAADAHALTAELASRASDAGAAATALDLEISAALAAADDALALGEPATDVARLRARAARTASRRALVLDGSGQRDDAAALAAWVRAHELGAAHAPDVAGLAARVLLDRDPAQERRWLDAVLDATPEPELRARLLVRRARSRGREAPDDAEAARAALGDVAAALAVGPALASELRKDALDLEAELKARAGDARGHAAALAARAELPGTAAERAAADESAARAWLAADEPAAALPLGTRAAAELEEGPTGPLARVLRRRVLETLGEAAWRQRAWGDVVRAYRPLVGDGDAGASLATFAYRLAVASDKLSDADGAIDALERLVAHEGAPRDLVGHGRRMLADLYERADAPERAAAQLEAMASEEDAGVSTAARAEALYRAGELHRRLLQPADAVRCLEAALRLVDGHLPALDSLEQIERERGDLERVATILGRKIAATSRQPSRQKALCARLAQLQVELARPEIALATARRALELDAGYRPALRIVAELARARNDHDEAARAYLALLHDAPGRAPTAGDGPSGDDLTAAERKAAADALEALAELHPNADWAGAASAAVERERPPAVSRTSTDRTFPPQSTPGHAPAVPVGIADEAPSAPMVSGAISLRALADEAAEREAWPELVAHLQALAELLGERGARKADALLELADVYYDRLGDVPRARATMRAAAAAYGAGTRGDATLRVLAAECAAGRDLDDAAAAYLAIAPERRTAADVAALAKVYQRAGKDHAAGAVLEEARAAGKLSDEGAMLLFALTEERRRKAELAVALERRAAAGARAEAAGVRQLGMSRAEARLRLGEALTIYRDALGDEIGAARVAEALARLDELERSAGGADTDDDDPPEGDTAVFGRVTAEDAEAALAPAPAADDYEHVQVDHDDAAKPGVVTHPGEIERLAAAAADVGDHLGATSLYADALIARARSGADAAELAPTRAALHAAAAHAGKVDLHAKALTAAAAFVPVPFALELLGEAAAVARAAGAPPVAIDALQKAMGIAPHDEHFLAELTELLRAGGEHSRLADLLETTARTTEGRVRARALYELGVVHRDAWGDALRSTELLSAAHRADPELADVWLPLADALVAGDDLHGARALYERALSHGAPDSVRTFIEDRLAMLDRADAVTSGEIGARALAPTVAMTVPIPEPDFDHALAAHEEDSDRRVTDVMAVAERVTAPFAAVAASERVTSPFEAVGARVVDLGPPDAPDPADATASAASARPVHNRITEKIPIAKLPLAHGTDPVVPRTDPPLPRTTAPYAVVRATGTLRITGAPDDRELLASTLRGVFGAWRPPAAGPELGVPTADASADHDRDLSRARILAEAGQLDQAIATAEKAALHSPTLLDAHGNPDLRALALLEDLYARNGDSDAVTEVIGRQIVATPDPLARAKHWRRRAALYRDVLHREAETYRCLREAHAAAPDDADIAYELRAVAMARGEWALTAELLYREIAAATNPRDRGALHCELAMVYDEKLIDPDQALRNYEQALALDPEIPAARRPLAHLYELAGRHTEAARWYERAAMVAKPTDKNLLLEHAAAAASRAGLRVPRETLPPPTSPVPLIDDDALADLARRLAAAEALDDHATAHALADEINLRDPRHAAAFRVLRNHAEQVGDLAALTALYERRAGADPSERAHLTYELGRLTEAAGRLDDAGRLYDHALGTDADHPGALEARAALAIRQGDWVHADQLFARIQPARSTLSSDALLLRRAELAELLGKDADALALARKAAALPPPRKDAFTTVVRLAQKVGDHAAAVAAGRALLELIPPGDVEAVIAAKVELAELCKRAGDPAAAIAWLEQVTAEDPLHAAALAELAELYGARGNWPAAARTVRALVGLADTPAKKAELLHKSGAIAIDHLADAAAADDAFLKASDLDPAHAPTLRRLLDVYWRADDPDALSEVATELVEQHALLEPETAPTSLARALVATAASGALRLASAIAQHLGDDAPARVAAALVEIAGRPATAQLGLDAAASALRDLANRQHGPALDALAAAARASGAPEAEAIAAALAQ